MNSSKSLPVVDKRLIERKFCGNLGSLLGFGNAIIFASFQDFGKWDSRRQWLNKCVTCISGLLGRCLRHLFGMPSSPQASLNFNEFANLCMSQGLTISNGVSSTDASRAWTLVSTRHSWFSSHRSHWFSKQWVIALTFSFEWYVIPKAQWTAVDALGPSLFISGFAIGHRAWGVTSVLYFPLKAPVTSYMTSARTEQKTQLPAVPLLLGESVVAGTFLPSRSSATDISSRFALLALSPYIITAYRIDVIHVTYYITYVNSAMMERRFELSIFLLHIRIRIS
jgi:hypothetical protein